MEEPTANRRLKVVTMVDGIGSYGGAETLARQVAQTLDPARFESTFCVTRWESRPEYQPALAELRGAGVDFIGVRRGSRFDLRPWRRVVKLIRDRRIDIVHSHKIGSNIWGAIVSSWAPVPIFVAHEHSWSYEGQMPRRMLDRHLIANRADAFVAVSEADRRRMAEIEKISESKLRFIPNGIPESRDPDPAAAVRTELGIPADAPVVGVVATLRPEKILDVLIRATASLSEEFPDLRLLIVGGSEGDKTHEGDRLKALAEQLRLSSRVIFTGLRMDIPELLETMDVTVLCSEREGSPLSVMEYMQSAKPVVATRVGGLPDLVHDGVNGLLVEPHNAIDLAEAIVTLLRDPALARQMGRRGREMQKSEFSIEATTRRVEDLYEELALANHLSGFAARPDR